MVYIGDRRGINSLNKKLHGFLNCTVDTYSRQQYDINFLFVQNNSRTGTDCRNGRKQCD